MDARRVHRLETDLAESQEQRAALSEILQVIRQSRTDVQPVFETILRSAKRLCDAVWGVIMRVDGDVIDVAALDVPSEGRADLRQRYPAPLSAQTGSAQAARERRIVQIVDVEADPTLTDARRRLARIVGYRSQLFVPILSGAEVFGVISVSRAEPVNMK